MSSPIPAAAVAVDLVLLTIRSEALCSLLVKRAVPPFRGRLALPGGFVQPGEDLDDAATRELAEETGLAGLPVHLEQLRSYGKPRRDPRVRVVSVAYLALGPDLPSPAAGNAAAGARWEPFVDVGETARLAFDHDQILADGVERARSKLEYTALATAFCPGEFTVAELRRVYEIVWGVHLDARNFHRKVTSADQFLTPTGSSTTRNGGRPAMLFRKGEAEILMPPMLRPHP